MNIKQEIPEVKGFKGGPQKQLNSKEPTRNDGFNTDTHDFNRTALKSAKDWGIPDLSNIKEFDPTKIPKAGSGAIFGARGTGKTIIMRHLMYLLNKSNFFKKVFVVSHTAHLYNYDGLDYDFVPASNIISSIDESVLKNIWSEREAYALKRRAQNLELEEFHAIIFDDIVAGGAAKYSKMLETIYLEARHVGIFCVICTQHVTLIPPSVRKNLNFAIMFYPASQETRKILADEYLSLEHPRVGSEILKELTKKPFQTCAFLRGPNPREYSDHIFTFSAPQDKNGRPQHKPFKIGSGSLIRPSNKIEGAKKKLLNAISFKSSDRRSEESNKLIYLHKY